VAALTTIISLKDSRKVNLVVVVGIPEMRNVYFSVDEATAAIHNVELW
jgi:hypothetical protein